MSPRLLVLLASVAMDDSYAGKSFVAGYKPGCAVNAAMVAKGMWTRRQPTQQGEAVGLGGSGFSIGYWQKWSLFKACPLPLFNRRMPPAGARAAL
jgi:hypothetical protein